jgi:hypothetical protein
MLENLFYILSPADLQRNINRFTLAKERERERERERRKVDK